MTHFYSAETLVTVPSPRMVTLTLACILILQYIQMNYDDWLMNIALSIVLQIYRVGTSLVVLLLEGQSITDNLKER